MTRKEECMCRKLVIVLTLLSLIGAFAFTEGQGEAAPAEGQKYNLVFASNASPQAPNGAAALKFEEEIERTSGGQIAVECYLSGSLTTQEGRMPALRKGTIDFTMGGPNWINSYVPYASMYAAAYIFEDPDHMLSVMNGELGQQLNEDLVEAAGVRMLHTMYMGTRQLNLRDIGRVVKTPADMEGVKLRMPNTESWQFMGEALGASPTPLSFSEIYLALQTGTIDGQDNPINACLERSFYEVSKYIIETGHYVNPIIPMINEDTWQSLTPELQQKVAEAWKNATEWGTNEVRSNEGNVKKKLQDFGMEFVEVDRQLWKDHVLNYYLENDISDNWDMDLYDQVTSP